MIQDFDDWRAICELKARYCRLLDTKQWDAWGALFTEDFVLDTSAGGGPATPVVGRDANVASVRQAIETVKTAHHIHAPEIVVDGDTATGIWALQDRLIFASGDAITGYGHYTETYARQDGAWLIATSRLTRLFVDFTKA